MTFETNEESYQAGAPVELYLFARGAQVWRYTSAEVDIEFDSETWSAVKGLSRSAIQSSNEKARNSLTLTTPRDLAIADLFRAAPPTDIISLTVIRFHRGDTDSAQSWVGRVLNVEWAGAQARISCEPVSISLGRTGLRRLYQTACPHVLYGNRCMLDKADFAQTCEVTAIDGNTITVDALGDFPYAGGFIEFEVDEGNIERRFTRSFVGLVLTLAQQVQGLDVGDPVTVYPGCNHTMQVCDEVYGNILNYGGMPLIPVKNVFDGTPVY